METLREEEVLRLEEALLKRMEERVIKTIPKDETREMASIGRAIVKPALPGQGSKVQKSSHKKRSAEEAFRQIEEWAHGHQDPSPDNFLPRQEPKSGEGTGLLTEGVQFLPSMEIQEHLSEVFFDCIYGQSYLLLHKLFLT